MKYIRSAEDEVGDLGGAVILAMGTMAIPSHATSSSCNHTFATNYQNCLDLTNFSPTNPPRCRITLPPRGAVPRNLCVAPDNVPYYTNDEAPPWSLDHIPPMSWEDYQGFDSYEKGLEGYKQKKTVDTEAWAVWAVHDEQCRDRFEPKVQKLETTISELNRDYEELRRNNAELREDKAELMDTKAALEKDKKDLTDEKAALEKDKKDLTDKKTALEKDKKDLTDRKKALERDKKDLNNNLKVVKSAKETLAKSHADCLRELNKPPPRRSGPSSSSRGRGASGLPKRWELGAGLGG